LPVSDDSRPKEYNMTAFSAGATPAEAIPLSPPVSERDRRRGPDGAPVVLVEYADFECPRCGRYARRVQAVKDRLGAELQVVFRHFPLSNIHPHAELAAEAAEAAGRQSCFWSMHDALFAHQAQLSRELIVSLARELGLDLPRFLRELDERTHRAQVKEHFMSGVRSGVQRTPALFINGVRYDDAWEADTLTAALMLAARMGRPRAS
jgi:protein-disulfide isomerase